MSSDTESAGEEARWCKAPTTRRMTPSRTRRTAASSWLMSAMPAEPEEEDGIKPLSDRLLTELTAYRTLALRDALGKEPGIAYLALLHALCLRLFYRYGAGILPGGRGEERDVRRPGAGLNDTPMAERVDERHQSWAAQLPDEPSDLWDVLAAFDSDSREALFAHCVALSVNARHEPYNRRPRALAHADALAEAIGLDVAAAGWSPTVENYLGRVTKARILEAVREAKGEQAAQRLDHLKKGEMAEKAPATAGGFRLAARAAAHARAWRRTSRTTMIPGRTWWRANT